MVQQYRKDTSVNSISGPDKANYQAQQVGSAASNVDRLIRFAGNEYTDKTDAKIRADTAMQTDLANRREPPASDSTIEGKRVYAGISAQNEAAEMNVRLKDFATTNPTEEEYQARVIEETEALYTGQSDRFGEDYNDPELRAVISNSVQGQVNDAGLFRQATVLNALSTERQNAMSDMWITNPQAAKANIGTMNLTGEEDEGALITAIQTSTGEQQANLIEMSKGLNFGRDTSLYQHSAAIQGIDKKANREKLQNDGTVGYVASLEAQNTLVKMRNNGDSPEARVSYLTGFAQNHYKETGAKLPTEGSLYQLANSSNEVVNVKANGYANAMKTNDFSQVTTGVIKSESNKMFISDYTKYKKNPTPENATRMIAKVSAVTSSSGGVSNPAIKKMLGALVNNDTLTDADGNAILANSNAATLSLLPYMSKDFISKQTSGDTRDRLYELKDELETQGGTGDGSNFTPATIIQSIQHRANNPKPVKLNKTQAGDVDAVIDKVVGFFGDADFGNQDGYVRQAVLNSFPDPSNTSEEAQSSALSTVLADYVNITVPELGPNQGFLVKGTWNEMSTDAGISSRDDFTDALYNLDREQADSKAEIKEDYGVDTFLVRRADGFYQLFSQVNQTFYGKAIPPTELINATLRTKEGVKNANVRGADGRFPFTPPSKVKR